MKNKMRERCSMDLGFWIINTDELAKTFAEKYFGKDSDQWWVADEIGGVYFINDYFFNLLEMVEFLRYKYTRKMMFDYYEYKLEFEQKQYDNDPRISQRLSPICIRDYKKMK